MGSSREFKSASGAAPAGPEVRRSPGANTVTQHVAEQLRGEIIRGEIPGGTRLLQVELSQRFGVSTSPIREALAILNGFGLVRLDPRRGAVVYRPSAQELLELWELRFALERLVVQHVIENAPDQELRSLLERVGEELQVEPSQRAELHRQFHLDFFKLAGTPRLVEMVAGLRDVATNMGSLAGYERGRDRENEHHRGIIQACLDRDVAAALEAVQIHLSAITERNVGIAAEDLEPRIRRVTAGLAPAATTTPDSSSGVPEVSAPKQSGRTAPKVKTQRKNG
jgi:DNA-binding GntR family transcriptional regulator